MEHNEHKGKQTPGKMTVFGDFGEVTIQQEVPIPDGTRWPHEWAVADMCGHLLGGDEERAANAALVCEAFNVANETQMWPREMQERIKMLEEALRVAMKSLGTYGPHPLIEMQANKALTTPSTIN